MKIIRIIRIKNKYYKLYAISALAQYCIIIVKFIQIFQHIILKEIPKYLNDVYRHILSKK